MEFVPYDKESNTPAGISLADFARSVMMSIYQEKNPGASEADISNAHDVIEAFFFDVKQWFEVTMQPIHATIKLAENQYSIPGYLVERYGDIIMQSDNPDVMLNECKEMRDYIDRTIDELQKDAHMRPYETLFLQAIDAYKIESYDLAVLGFFAIIDGLLSDITADHISVAIKERTKKIVNIDAFHITKDHSAIDTVLQKLSLLMVSELLSKTVKFDKPEPDTLNRHWAMHGRTRIKKTKADCEKLILFIYSLISTAENANKE